MLHKFIHTPAGYAAPHSFTEQLDWLLIRARHKFPLMQEEICEKKIKLEGKTVDVVYSKARDLRKNPEALSKRGIALPKAPPFYECVTPGDNISRHLSIIAEKTYQSLTPAEKAYFQTAWFLNREQETVKVNLAGYWGKSQKFLMGANFLPFGQDHLIIWSAPQFDGKQISGLRQVYHGIHHLYWITDLLKQFNDSDYRLFYNSMGTGNSSDILHFQMMKEKLPAFAHFTRYYPDVNSSKIIHTSRRAWPFKGILARYNSETQKEVLGALTGHIKSWLHKNPHNTLNLAAQTRPNGMYEMFIIYRVAGRYYVPGMTNEFSGAEAAGRIGLSNLIEFRNFADIERLELRSSSRP